MTGRILFEEEQRFTQKWVKALVLAAIAFLVFQAIYPPWQQIYLGRPYGDRSVSDTTLLLISGSQLVLAFALTYLFFRMKLVTSVDNDTIYIRMRPLLNKRIALSEVAQWEARTYSPILDYGGWGIRYSISGKGWAYNMSGNRGVQLVLQSGKQILIGSQRPEELEAAITSAKGQVGVR